MCYTQTNTNNVNKDMRKAYFWNNLRQVRFKVKRLDNPNNPVVILRFAPFE